MSPTTVAFLFGVEANALGVCICAACVGAKRVGEVLAVLADRFLEVQP